MIQKWRLMLHWHFLKISLQKWLQGHPFMSDMALQESCYCVTLNKSGLSKRQIVRGPCYQSGCSYQKIASSLPSIESRSHQPVISPIKTAALIKAAVHKKGIKFSFVQKTTNKRRNYLLLLKKIIIKKIQ